MQSQVLVGFQGVASQILMLCVQLILILRGVINLTLSIYQGFRATNIVPSLPQ